MQATLYPEPVRCLRQVRWRRTGVILLSVALLWKLTPDASAQSGGIEPSQSNQLFQFEPETPERLVNAVVAAERLQRPLDARRYLRKLREQMTTTQELQNLRRNFGIGPFLQFRANPDLHPEAAELLQAINDASRPDELSDSRLAELVQQLGTRNRGAADAVAELLGAGEPAVPALLAADTATAAGQIAQRMLSTYARELRYGLLNALPTADETTRIRLLKLLGTTSDSAIMPALVRWQFAPEASEAVAAEAKQAIQQLAGSDSVPESPDQALQLLKREVHRELIFAGSRFSPQDVPGTVSRRITDGDRAAAVSRAQLYARDAVAMAPDDSSTGALFLVSQLAAEPPVLQVDNVVQNSDLELNRLSELLEKSLVVQNSAAAIAVLRQWELHLEDSRPVLDKDAVRTLRQAFEFPDSRVRLLAARLASRNAVAVDSRMTADVLSNVVSGSQTMEAVVIDIDGSRSTELADVLIDNGYTAVAARTGVQGFEAAVRQLNCELILIQANCIRWDLSPTIANLRADIRTRWTPIVIYGPSTAEASGLSLARRYPGIWFIREPLGAMTLIDQLQFINVELPLLSEQTRAEMQTLAAQSAL